ncbi:MAG: CAP domain-containing protein [Treponema sp.]|nr:CAP domain-containing protein [Treponema sp.]
MKKCLFFALFALAASTSLFSGTTKAKSSSSKTTNSQSSISAGKTAKSQTSSKSSPNKTKSSTASTKSKGKSLATLDTARNVDYLSDFEKDVIFEMNKARADPKQFADLYLVPRLKNFDGKLYIEKGTDTNPCGRRVLTREGAAVVKECIEYMYNQTPRSPLRPSKGLTKAAKEHAESQVLTNGFGHDRIDGTNPFENMRKYGSFMAAGENISYGMTTARNTVLQLLIDDGVASRGHRTNLMAKNYSSAGVGFAENKDTGKIECVIDYAQNYVER